MSSQGFEEQIIQLKSLLKEKDTELNKALNELNYNSTHDLLTDLPNRTFLCNKVKEAIEQYESTQMPFSLIFLDLNRFKNINDTLGHIAGDRLLINIGRRIQSCVSENGIVTRYGGDEFIILLFGKDIEQYTTNIVGQISHDLLNPFYMDELILTVTASIGISIYPKDGKDFDNMVNSADVALHQAKKSRANLFKFYDEGMNSHVLEKMKLENNLRLALENNSFSLFYQPLSDFKTGKIIGMEALLRWQHPKLGEVPPQKFITIAEENGLIVPLGKWVLETACMQAKAWQDMGLSTIVVAVNISPLQIQQPDFISMVKNVLKKAQLQPEYLELELTESLLIDNSDEMKVRLEELKSFGVKLVIDDFGTGYSSLSYLSQFPVNKIKIDRSFVMNYTPHPDDSAIIQAIIAIGHALNLKVLAEGVETLEQFTFLRDNDCDEMQGHYFSRALTAEASTKLLEEKGLL